ncbi:nuclear transport factor 2 family protein [Novosphingobium sp. BL-52-GroH]|uniref:nuclear transport factor 2 family protein n=1 Tax=Novosphingobium sp. BL-52-GroH TaxID=3349877 RepID=UPI00384DB073
MTENARIAADLMGTFGIDMEPWWAIAHDELVLEFPFARSIGMPERVEGKAASRTYLEKVVSGLDGLHFTGIDARETGREGEVLVEYLGQCPAPNGTYDQRYITIMRFRDGRLALFREYWDTTEVTRAFGDLAAAF